MGLLLHKFEYGRNIIHEAQNAYNDLMVDNPHTILSPEQLLEFSLEYSNGFHII